MSQLISHEYQRSPEKSDTISVILGTPEHIVLGNEEGLTNKVIDDIPNTRKIKISVKGDTEEYRQHKKK